MSEIVVAEWVAKAEQDYQAAVTLVRKRKQPVPDVVCFHCQQCAEKYPKAFLVRSKVFFPKIHDLLELKRLCVSVDPDFELIGDWLDHLNPYATEFRYPGEGATVNESREAVTIMKKVRRFVRAKLGLPSKE